MMTKHCGVCDRDIPLDKWNDSHTEFKTASTEDVMAVARKQAQYWSDALTDLAER